VTACGKVFFFQRIGFADLGSAGANPAAIGHALQGQGTFGLVALAGQLHADQDVTQGARIGIGIGLKPLDGGNHVDRLLPAVEQVFAVLRRRLPLRQGQVDPCASAIGKH
jgi:hypothetical protein